jgi:hypothetical protein
LKNLSELKDALRMRAGNLPASDPVWSGAENGSDFINRGVKFMVTRAIKGARRTALKLFPELEERWHVRTRAENGSLDLPENWMAIDSVWSYDDGDEAEPDQFMARRREVIFIDEEYYENAHRSADPVGYPTTCVRMGEKLYVHPTPGADYETWLLVKGIALPPELVNDDDVPTLRGVWEDAIEDAAAYILYKRLGWDAEASRALGDLDNSIGMVLSPATIERIKRGTKVRVKGMPRG